jgi:hypothetical protein
MTNGNKQENVKLPTKLVEREIQFSLFKSFLTLIVKLLMQVCSYRTNFLSPEIKLLNQVYVFWFART